MARDDRLKKVSEAGADFLETARAKAEEFLKELSRAGGDTQGRAQGALDDLVVGGRKGTEAFVATIRKEIQNQLGALGLATKSDLDALERRLSGRTAPAKATGATKATGGTARKSAGARKTPATKTTGTKTTGTKTTGTRTAATKSTAGTKAAAKKAPAKKTAG